MFENVASSFSPSSIKGFPASSRRTKNRIGGALSSPSWVVFQQLSMSIATDISNRIDFYYLYEICTKLGQLASNEILSCVKFISKRKDAIYLRLLEKKFCIQKRCFFSHCSIEVFLKITKHLHPRITI